MKGVIIVASFFLFSIFKLCASVRVRVFFFVMFFLWRWFLIEGALWWRYRRVVFAVTMVCIGWFIYCGVV